MVAVGADSMLLLCMLALAVGCGFAALLRQTPSRGRFPKATPEWVNTLSTAKYRPMERLLTDDDFNFVGSQPRVQLENGQEVEGATAPHPSNVSALDQDFHRLCDGLRMVMLSSTQDRPDLAVALFKQRVSFTIGLALVRLRIAMHATDWATADIRALVDTLHAVRDQFQQLAPATARAAV